MLRPAEIQKEEVTTNTLSELTSAFEGIASSRLAIIRNQVLSSSVFFEDIWNMYLQLRVDSFFHFGRGHSKDEILNRELFILITAEGGFSGDIDKRLIDTMLDIYKPDLNDIIVVGHHGAIQLKDMGISYVKYFKLPSSDQNINVLPLVKEVQKYKSTSVFYQKYISLTNQKIERIQLSSFVQVMGRKAETVKKVGTEQTDEDLISEQTYIFEPTAHDVVDFLERSMLYVALAQLILDSKLAQYASRFRAMSAAHLEAEDTGKALHLKFRQATRAIKDERLKEITNTVRKLRMA
ncbi:MAG TPA: F0F1 ATP synthase subunit gamma [Candidatus Saccharimonadales bacterium]|nr:F0F1 ATP synthase subunit gamma [Candidatus Saccharimonadales bacterium]